LSAKAGTTSLKDIGVLDLAMTDSVLGNSERQD
jgi:hypothetical protein